MANCRAQSNATYGFQIARCFASGRWYIAFITQASHLRQLSHFDERAGQVGGVHYLGNQFSIKFYAEGRLKAEHSEMITHYRRVQNGITPVASGLKEDHRKAERDSRLTPIPRIEILVLNANLI